jgi:MinD superfamily P-loop ATPase
MAGMHDLHRIIDTTRHFGVLPMVCINKADIDLAYAKRIEAECLAIGVETIGRIPFDLNVTQAMTCGQPVTAYAPNCPASQAIRTIWDRLLTQFDIQHEGEDVS